MYSFQFREDWSEKGIIKQFIKMLLIFSVGIGEAGTREPGRAVRDR